MISRQDVIMPHQDSKDTDNWSELKSGSAIDEMTKEELHSAMLDSSRLWLAHDGLWFQAVESMHGMDDAIKADTDAWRVFTVLEAKRILERIEVEFGKGNVDDLAQALRHRLYANINKMKIEKSDNKIRMTMVNCRVQSARQKKSLDPFPCKSVGIVEYSEFAKTVNPKFITRCNFCPPDKLPDCGHCQWEFELID
jgi:hypothetical protein